MFKPYSEYISLFMTIIPEHISKSVLTSEAFLTLLLSSDERRTEGRKGSKERRKEVRKKGI